MVLKPDFWEVRMEADYFLSKQNLTDPWIDAKQLDFGEKKIYIDSIQHYASLFNRPITDFTCESISGCEVVKDENRNLEKQIEQYKKFSQEQQANEYNNKLSDFKKIYDFHNLSTNPKYTFADDTMLYCGIYFSPDKSLNFIYINGEKNIENIAVIPYDKIHYYDKSGNIHYTSTIDAEYHVNNSLKGSFTGGKSSVLAIMAGGLLFGTMGMIAGAAISHKPAENIISQENSSNISISSSIHKIDDRNVILNYYSDTIKQFADIELPYDIYNFLQTYLPEKKYEIVINLEKDKYQNYK